MAEVMYSKDRPKGKILSVGYIINGIPECWQFDGLGICAALEIAADGELFYVGYSVLELEKISNEFWGSKIEE